jgi:hypothetical protein
MGALEAQSQGLLEGISQTLCQQRMALYQMVMKILRMDQVHQKKDSGFFFFHVIQNPKKYLNRKCVFKKDIDKADGEMVLISGPQENIWDKLNENDELECVDYIPNICNLYKEDEEKEFGRNVGYGEHNNFVYDGNNFNEFGERLDKIKNEIKAWNQKDVTLRMRLKLLDWLVDVHRKFKLVTRTLYLAINLLDKYLGRKQIARTELQLYGCGCLWIASKYHDIFPPALCDFVYISDSAFDINDLKVCEELILHALSFSITNNTCLSFIELYIPMVLYPLKAKLLETGKAKLLETAKSIIMFLTEHSLLDYDLANNYRPSMIAAAVVAYTLLGLKIQFHNYPNCKNKSDDTQRLKELIWPKEFVNYTGYSLQQLKHVIIKLDVLRKQPKYKAISNKYARAQFQCISKIDFEKLDVVNTFFAD